MINKKIPLDAKITTVSILLISMPIILVYLFIRFGIINPIKSLFGVKK